ncbi:transcription elongation factor Elf1 [Haloferula luteola]|uniref:Transcription elongation factor Elf1 n=1 Tax=Haloferula luteola TaxID=595692 RepID=A0A840V109_9BACT|nr:transcription elongation factor Elf1 [Haloferula luteola]
MRKEPCPRCGQSGLQDALLKNLENLRVVLCQECEALRVGESTEDFYSYVQFEEFMESKHAEADWKQVEFLD